jgi:hypothetical protein
MPTLILIERARVLISEKMSVLKEDFRKSTSDKKVTERKSGSLKYI